MTQTEIHKRIQVLLKKEKELGHLTALMKSIKKHQEEWANVPNQDYLQNIQKRIDFLEKEFDTLLK